MESIKISVSGNLTSVISALPVVAGTVGLPVEFSFDPTWGALKKTAVFRVGSKTRDVYDVGELVTVPWELLQNPGCRLWAGVYGVNAEGSLQIPTVWADLGVVQPGADPSGDESADPALPVWEQVQKDMLRCIPQNLSLEEQNQARKNIGAMADGAIRHIDNTNGDYYTSLYDTPNGTYILTGNFKLDRYAQNYEEFHSEMVTIGDMNGMSKRVSVLRYNTLVWWEVLNNRTYGHLEELETTKNRVTVIDETADNLHYPTAKAVYSYVGNMETALDSIIAIQESLIGGAAK